MTSFQLYQEYFNKNLYEHPYTDDTDAARELLAMVDACLETAYYWIEIELDHLDMLGVVITPQETEEALMERRLDLLEEKQAEREPALSTFRAQWADILSHIASRAEASKQAESTPKIWQLAQLLDLNEVEFFCLILSFALELDRKYERLYGYLQDNIAAKLPTVGLGLSLYGLMWEEDSLDLLFSDHSRLWDILEPPENPRPQESLLSRPMALQHHIVDWLLGRTETLSLYRGMERFASVVPCVFGWDDLVISPGQKELLQQLSSRVQNRNLVMKTWGFESILPYGSGISAIFYGPPGTGKTMAAQVIAKELNLPLFRVDISTISSKYIGETEKNLRALFEEAEKKKGILFFDEADALFSKRSVVSNSNDRYANMETGFLLQKIEEYKGISILATNLLNNLDEAFKRRIQYFIRFSMPDVTMRLTLWEKMFPANAPLDENLYLEEYAQRYELTGSGIKEVAVNSAFLAAAQQEPIGDVHIMKALEIYYEKLGIRMADLFMPKATPF